MSAGNGSGWLSGFGDWGVQDSNLRRHSHLIYSQAPLTARETPLFLAVDLLGWGTRCCRPVAWLPQGFDHPADQTPHQPGKPIGKGRLPASVSQFGRPGPPRDGKQAASAWNGPVRRTQTSIQSQPPGARSERPCFSPIGSPSDQWSARAILRRKNRSAGVSEPFRRKRSELAAGVEPATT